MRTFAAFLILLTASFVAPAQSYDSGHKPAAFNDPERLKRIEETYPAIDGIYRNWMTQNHIPGLAYGVIVDGKLVHTGSYGYTDIKKTTPVTPKSVFRIASMSKSFTAMAILALRDDGKLNLDDPVEQYIPEMKALKYVTKDSPPITIRHLLTHGSGFPEDNPWGDRQLSDSDEELLKLIRESPSMSNSPGINYEYANLGFALLGRIITVVSKKPYQQYIREKVWTPLGMNSTYWEYSDVPEGRLAHGYRWIYEDWSEEELLHDKADGSWGAMGGMLTSIEDFSSYAGFHISSWPPSNEDESGPIRRSSVREMHMPWRISGFLPNFAYGERKCAAFTAYAYGLNYLRDCDSRIYVGHSGGLPGFGSQWRFLPEYGIGIVAFANRTYSPVAAVNLEVLDKILTSARLSPRTLPPSEILKRRQAELVSIILENDWEKAEKSGIFAENFFPDYRADILKKNFAEKFAEVGEFVKATNLRAENQLRGTFTIECKNGKFDVWFSMSPENPPLIQAIAIR
ncbi:MAG: serine hydrolase domain-containing protein [Pyrinomonadaceae bacterium]